MGILEAIIRALLYLCGVAIAFYLTVWVLASIGIALPIMVITILKVVFVLIAILILLRLIWPIVAGYSWFPNRNP